MSAVTISTFGLPLKNAWKDFGRIPLADDDELVLTGREGVMDGPELLGVLGDLLKQRAVLGQCGLGSRYIGDGESCDHNDAHG